MRKTAAALAAALLLLLTACGSVPEPTAAPAATPSPSPTAAPTHEPTPTSTPEPLPEDMVQLRELVPGIYTDARYATAENFTGEVIYDGAEVYLRRGTAEKLASVQAKLEEAGLSLLVWDGWRPVAAQFALWRACPDARYVSNPFGGITNHCRGNTVDLTLVTLDGVAVEMPSGFDDFSALADRDYSDVSETAAANARLLETLMSDAGFSGYYNEWWHYTDCEDYQVCEALGEPEYFSCPAQTGLLAAPQAGAEMLAAAPAGSRLRLLDSVGSYLLVSFEGQYGYVLKA